MTAREKRECFKMAVQLMIVIAIMVTTYLMCAYIASL